MVTRLELREDGHRQGQGPGQSAETGLDGDQTVFHFLFCSPRSESRALCMLGVHSALKATILIVMTFLFSASPPIIFIFR